MAIEVRTCPAMGSLMVILLWIPLSLAAQDSLNVELFLQELEDESVVEADFLLQLEWLQNHPLSLNEASLSELLQIPFLGLEEARAILRYRREKGAFSSLAELDSVPGLHPELRAVLRPYLVIQPPRTGPKFYFRQRLGRRFPPGRGFTTGQIHNGWESELRFSGQPSPRWQWHLVWQKDAGEMNWVDYGSLSIQYHPPGKPYRFLLGDFQFRWAQQLVIGEAYGLPISVWQLRSTFPRPSIARPHRSSQESFFLRGFLAETAGQWGHFWIGISSRKLDGRLSADSSLVQSFDVSGMHRSALERSRKNNTGEQLGLIALIHQRGWWQAGVLAMVEKFNRPILLQGDTLGSSLTYFSGSMSLQWRHLTWSGEAALFRKRYPAVQQSLRFTLRPLEYWITAYSVHWRYWSFRGRAFGEVLASAGNRAGAATGLEYRPASGSRLALLLHSWQDLREEETLPPIRKSLQLLWQQQVGQLNLALRYTFQKKGEEPNIHRLRMDLRARLTRWLWLRQRAETGWTRPTVPAEISSGFSSFLEASLQANPRWRLRVRWTQYQVPAYPYRLYEFEPDVPGSFRVALLNGRGYKWLMLLTCWPARNVRLDFKYRRIFAPDESQLGSGLLAVSGNRQSEIRLQVAVRY